MTILNKFLLFTMLTSAALIFANNCAYADENNSQDKQLAIVSEEDQSATKNEGENSLRALIDELRQIIAEQQKQIEELRQLIAEQQKQINELQGKATSTSAANKKIICPMNNKTIKIVCLGDSITLGTKYVIPDETYEAQLSKILESANIKCELINAGVGSETTTDGLKRFEQDVISRKPDYVIILYGANDSYIEKDKTSPRVPIETYQDNLLKMVALSRQAGIVPILITPTPIGSKCKWASQYPYNERGANFMIEKYADIVREIAVSQAIAFIDLRKAFETVFIEKNTTMDVYTVDGIHPNSSGYEIIAHTIFKNITCNNNITE